MRINRGAVASVREVWDAGEPGMLRFRTVAGVGDQVEGSMSKLLLRHLLVHGRAEFTSAPYELDLATAGYLGPEIRITIHGSPDDIAKAVRRMAGGRDGGAAAYPGPSA